MPTDNLPTWTECDDKWSNLKSLTALEQFIFDWQPGEDARAESFRMDLAAVLEEVRRAQR